MARRFPVDVLSAGVMLLDAAESHHARDVMRLGVGDAVELFDGSGQTASGRITQVQPTVAVQVQIIAPPPATAQLIIASAVPKGNRADWMIEKLAEIGVARFIPLQTARSVVHPEGAGKVARWQRLASEAAKQSHRTGTLEIAPLTPLPELLRELKAQPGAAGWFLSTDASAQGFADAAAALQTGRPIYLIIGPEGGWTPQEEDALAAAGSSGVGLTPSVLRIETAALVAAGAVASWLNRRSGAPEL